MDCGLGFFPDTSSPPYLSPFFSYFVKRIHLSEVDLSVSYCVILLFQLFTEFSFLKKDREVEILEIFWFDHKIFKYYS